MGARSDVGSIGETLRVAMFLHNEFTSDMRVAREASALVTAGWDVTVLCLRGRSLPQVEERDGYHIRRVVAPGQASWSRPWSKVREMRDRSRRLAEAAVKLRPHVVHCHDTDTLAAGVRAADVTGARLVYDAHELFPDMLAGHGRDSWIVQTYWRRIEARLMPRADLVITVNESRAGVLKERYGVDPVTVLNTPALEPLADRAILREATGAAESDLIVLYQGGLIGGRALPRLVEAVSTLDDVLLVIEGDGPEMEAMRRAAAVAGCEDRVRFMGWIPAEMLHAHACGADIGVVIYENTSLNNYHAAPNKLYSYLMAGLPIVSSDFPGLREVVVPGGVGEVFDPSSAESIASAIRRLMDDPGARQDMKVRARALAEERYNWAVDASRFLEAYERLGT